MTANSDLRRRKPLRNAILEWLFAGGAILTLAGNSLDYLGGTRQRDVMLHVEACKRAQDAILDDIMSGALTENEKRVFITQQLRIAAKCGMDVSL